MDRLVIPGDSAGEDDRRAEAALESAALALLQERGVLAGLNLREVAERVGVNRSLVYHYFGNRRGLLRSAIRSRGEALLALVRQPRSKGFAPRSVELFEAVGISSRSVAQLAALLVIDGDPDIQCLPLAARSPHVLDDGRPPGTAPDADVQALLVLLCAAAAGYAILRERYAAEFDLGTPALDARVLAALNRLLSDEVAEARASAAEREASGLADGGRDPR